MSQSNKMGANPNALMWRNEGKKSLVHCAYRRWFW